LNLTQRTDARQIAIVVPSAVLSVMTVSLAIVAAVLGRQDRLPHRDQSEIVLSFDCTLSSLKTIVTVSLP
jgi:hypothetical protein